jgi:hypothetical protein
MARKRTHYHSDALRGFPDDFEWDTKLNCILGFWLTRGGWNGYHHLAVEPTNGAPDALADAAKTGRCGLIQPGELQSWNARIRVGT